MVGRRRNPGQGQKQFPWEASSLWFFAAYGDFFIQHGYPIPSGYFLSPWFLCGEAAFSRLDASAAAFPIQHHKCFWPLPAFSSGPFTRHSSPDAIYAGFLFPCPRQRCQLRFFGRLGQCKLTWLPVHVIGPHRNSRRPRRPFAHTYRSIRIPSWRQ